MPEGFNDKPNLTRLEAGLLEAYSILKFSKSETGYTPYSEIIQYDYPDTDLLVDVVYGIETILIQQEIDNHDS